MASERQLKLKTPRKDAFGVPCVGGLDYYGETARQFGLDFAAAFYSNLAQ